MGCIFLHIPKTGGTTFRKLLSQSGIGKQVYPSQSELLLNNGKYLPFNKFIVLPKFTEGKRSIYSGHYRYTEFINENLDTKYEFLTILRNPVDRVISHIYHLKKHNPKYTDFTTHEILHSNINLFTNLQAKYLGYNPKLKNLSETISNLQAIKNVGILDRFDNFIDKINDTFNISIKDRDQRYNVQSTTKKDISTEDLDLIIKRNRIDLILYNYAKYNLS